MPSTYAHRLFGEEMKKLYPAHVKALIKNDMPLYEIGLHGPDLMFYYKPLMGNPVQQIGYDLHSQSSKVFFEHAAKVIQSADDKAPYYAYAIGFVCHFALDSACHSYIENKIRVSEVKHTEIESEFDKYLIRLEGENPFKKDLVAHLSATREIAEKIAPFYDGLSKTGARVNGEHAYKALKSMLFYNRLMQGRNPFKRGIVNFSLKVSGNYPEMHGMMFAKSDILKCADSNLRLKKLFDRAKAECLYLTENFIDRADGKSKLCDGFTPTFGPAEGWRDIPVFDVEGEKRYEI